MCLAEELVKYISLLQVLRNLLPDNSLRDPNLVVSKLCSLLKGPYSCVDL
jgi:hypothetical protein